MASAVEDAGGIEVHTDLEWRAEYECTSKLNDRVQYEYQLGTS